MAIEIQNLKLGYGSRILLEGVSATLPQGSLTALIGRNGTGKSTLLRALMGLEPMLQGDILLQEKSLETLNAPQRARLISFVSTDKIRIPNLRCEDAVALGRAPYTNWIGHLQETDHQVVARALDLVGMASFARKSMDTLSDGECQRILIARALAQDTPIILLDEPTAFLDLPNRYILASLLARLAHDERKCILFSTHDLDIALRLCDRVALIDTPDLHVLSAEQMRHSSLIERLFTENGIRFDPQTFLVHPEE